MRRIMCWVALYLEDHVLGRPVFRALHKNDAAIDSML
jgi:hypothetical protein